MATALLAACGFRLQGSERWPQGWDSYSLDYPSRDTAMQDFVDILDEALRRRGLQPAGTPDFRIRLSQLIDHKSVAAIGTDGKAVEFELTRELRFQIKGRGWMTPVVSVSASRRLSFDPAVVLAKEAEEERLLEGLSRDLAQMLLLRAQTELGVRAPG